MGTNEVCRLGKSGQTSLLKVKELEVVAFGQGCVLRFEVAAFANG